MKMSLVNAEQIRTFRKIVTRRPIGDAVQRRIPHRPRTKIAILVALSSVWAVEEVTRDSLMSSL
jgi:hypothetical protein